MAGESPRGRGGCRGQGCAGLLGGGGGRRRAELCIPGSSLFCQLQTLIPAQPLTSPGTLRELLPCSATRCSHLSNGNDEARTASQRHRGDSQWLA